MSPEQNRDNEKSDLHRSSEESVSTPKREHQQRQTLDLHSPQVLVLHAVSSETVNLVLKGLMPEVAHVASDYLYELVRDNHTLARARLGEMYFGTAPFTISQTQTYTLGAGDAREISHKIIIAPDSKHDTGVVELQRSVASPGAVNVSIFLALVASERRWDWVNSIGALLGRNDLTALFVHAPAEQIEELDSEVRVTKLTPLISVKTLPRERSYLRQDPSSMAEDTHKRKASWVPTSMYCSLPVYSEERAILKILAPKHHDAVIASGLLRVADNFTRSQTDIRADRLQAISERLALPLLVEFKKELEIGEVEESYEDEWEQTSVESEAGALSGDTDETHESQQPEAFEQDAYYGASEEFSPDGEGQEFVDPCESDADCSDEEQHIDPADPEDESIVVISGLPSNEGVFSLFYRSGAELNGGAVLDVGENFNPHVQVFGVEFEEELNQLSAKQTARRWEVVSRMGAIVGSTVCPEEIQLSLDLARSSDGKRFGVDVLADRLAVYVKK